MKDIIGHLVPLQQNPVVDSPVRKIPIYLGLNIIGRECLPTVDKRVSRKHISLHASVGGSVEVVNEGLNPIIFRSGSERKKLGNQDKVMIGHYDILELIPGNHLFKYEEIQGEYGQLEEMKPSLSCHGKRPNREDTLISKRSRHTVDAGALSAATKDMEKGNKVQDVMSAQDKSSCSQVKPICLSDDTEALRHFHVSRDKLPFIFRLLQVQGLPAWANSSCVNIEDVIQGNVLIAILSNYMVDMDWLLSACPNLRKMPHVLILHGESSGRLETNKPKNWILHKPPLPISYGTHHSKAMILVYPKGIRVVVHTANLIYVDWNNKSQGLWMQDFPWKDQQDLNKGSPFENDLVDYLKALKWPEFRANLPNIGDINVNASFFKRFDYSSALVRLVASVPGYHMGSNLRKWGHMKLRSILEECVFDKEFCQSPLIYQFSSLGSLDEKWLAEFAVSTSSGKTSDRSPLGLGKPLIIWPTIEDVRCSIEGYAAGSCIPSPQKNVEKDFLKKYWARWKAKHVGRCRAMPHIKTYTRYNGQSLAWFLLTSANLSKAAWGALQKNNSQLMIRSYELGVLFLPLDVANRGPSFSCIEDGLQESKQELSETMKEQRTKLVTLCWDGSYNNNPRSEIIQLPVPYQIPPQPYTSEDVPWSWDRRYTKKDVYGQVWPR